MKTINVSFEDSEYAALLAKKNGTWHDFIMKLAKCTCRDNEINLYMPNEKKEVVNV